MTVPFIRFRKSLTTQLTEYAKPTDLQESSEDKERTILVINSTELTNILGELKHEMRGDVGPAPWEV